MMKEEFYKRSLVKDTEHWQSPYIVYMDTDVIVLAESTEVVDFQVIKVERKMSSNYTLYQSFSLNSSLFEYSPGV
jgi:hypothetical protein